MEEGQSSENPTGVLSNQSHLSLGLSGSLPELLKLDLIYRLNPSVRLGLSASPGWPFDVTVEMPSDVIRSDKTNTLAAAYTAFDANFKATWGPHVSANAFWHPLGGSWFVMGGGGYRELRLKGSAASQLRICTVAEAIKEPPCGNDQASIQTRNRLEVSANLTLTSWMLAGATGWVWRPWSTWEISMALGATKAVSTRPKIDVNAEIVAPDGTPQEVSGSLLELKSKSEQDVAAKAQSELRKFTDMTLPVASIGLGYIF